MTQIGPLTDLTQSVAAAVGAGMLLGGFAAGLIGIVRAWPRRQFDRRVLGIGYLGGAAATLLVILDIIFHRAV
ncbi:MAG TPA: hypothetical protein VFY04_09470 [Solirubrobacterales bacterium]|nr:hypothetical protein [Solirubrobacterales bacterium]